jgi:hypothetical protein
MHTVVEAVQVSEKIDAEVALYPRLEDAWDAFKWWLSHDPESGELIDDYHWLYKQRGNRVLNVPALVAIYTFDANEVVILSLLLRLPTL